MRRPTILMAAAVTVLLVQAVASYTLNRDPYLPSPPSLLTLPLSLDRWSQVKDGVIEPEVLNVLGPDDILSRDYRDPVRKDEANLFVAYYRSQLRSKNAHDPKVCLPGAGWNARVSRQIRIPVASGQSIPVNYYRIAKGGSEAVVLYWFQTHKGVYTFEQQLKLHRVVDAILDDRTDMALVRIIVPVGENGVDAADNDARRFAQLIYPQMLSYFPSKEKAGS